MEKAVNSLDNVVGTDAVSFQQFVTLTAAWDFRDGQTLDDNVGMTAHGRCNSLTDASFGVVVFNGHDLAASLVGAGQDGGSVDGLDGERVDDANVDAALLEDVSGLESFHQGHT